jgi:hypothetical protein
MIKALLRRIAGIISDGAAPEDEAKPLASHFGLVCEITYGSSTHGTPAMPSASFLLKSPGIPARVCRAIGPEAVGALADLKIGFCGHATISGIQREDHFEMIQASRCLYDARRRA